MLGQPRTTQRRARKVASDEGVLRGDIVRLASRFGRYGYRRVTDMLRIEGWGVNHYPGGADLEAGGAEGAGAAAEARSAVAQRRIVHPAEAAVSGPRLVVRLRGLEDARRACAEAADSAGRAHEGVPGDRGGSQDPLARRARGAGRSVRPTRASRVSEVGQRTGVHRQARAAVASQARRPDALHRARQLQPPPQPFGQIVRARSQLRTVLLSAATGPRSPGPAR